MISPENSRYLINQSDSKLNPAASWSPAFSRASGSLLVFTLFFLAHCFYSVLIGSLFLLYSYWLIVFTLFLLAHCFYSVLIDSLFLLCSYWLIVLSVLFTTATLTFLQSFAKNKCNPFSQCVWSRWALLVGFNSCLLISVLKILKFVTWKLFLIVRNRISEDQNLVSITDNNSPEGEGWKLLSSYIIYADGQY